MTDKDHLSIHLLLEFFGLFVMAFGIALTIQSGLGTTALTSVPYAYNLIFPRLSVGELTVIINLFFLILQPIILKGKIRKTHFLQLIAILLFGFFIDLHLGLVAGIHPNYWQAWLMILGGSAIIAFGIFMQIKADITLLPIDSFIMYASRTFNKNYGLSKISFDLVFILIAFASVLLFLGKIAGVREGTIAIMILVGYIVQFYQEKIHFLDKLLASETDPEEFIPEPYMTTDKFAITISRQYGSGGHEVGKMVAQKLGVAFYDSNLIELTAKEGGFTSEYVKKNEQKLASNLLYNFYKHNYAYANQVMPPQDALFLVQTKVIRDIAAAESCVIVGRCANYILKGHPNLFNVFVHADDTFRIERVIQNYGADSEENARSEMERVDKERVNYNKHYTGRDWSDLKEYDMSIESSRFGIDITAAMIIDARRRFIYTGDTKK